MGFLMKSELSSFKIIALIIFFVVYIGGSFYIYEEKLSNPTWYVAVIVIGLLWFTYLVLGKLIYEF
ncbi:hypothetical protein AKJ57_01475 [candidate division MSBL1 archaeon SCGC-AAA259A05]|uniref:Uncharacterized protein n=1 Tax=candidate division MSBL1 archaeon SCGC-AAA259A05 TaxID=1698259 RepID=A0A133UB23_9EURY|nr:hypothetical protein AKJ57_01475 [candidate division MSBL1 archaeon SCGC-AAA259A05]